MGRCRRGFASRCRSACVGAALGIVALGASPARSIVTVGSLDSYGFGRDLLVLGDVAYLAMASGGTLPNGLLAIDVSDPEMPLAAASLDERGAWDLARHGSRVLVAGGPDGLWIVDATDPLEPAEIGHLPTSSFTRAVAVSDAIVYLAEDDGLRVVDASDPTSPVEVGRFPTPGFALDVTVVGARAYVFDRSLGLRILDVSNPAQPRELGAFHLPGSSGWVSVDRDLAFVGSSGVTRIVDVSNPGNPVELSSFPRAGRTQRIADRLYVSSAWLTVVDISDLSAPIALGEFSVRGGAAAATIRGDLAYVAAGGVSGAAGLRIVDLVELGLPRQVGAFPRIRLSDIAVEDHFAYTLDGSFLESFDIRDPAAPVWLGFWLVDGEDLELVDGLLYVAGRQGLRILSTADPTNLRNVAQLVIGGLFRGSDVEIDGDHAFVAHERGLLVVDVSDPTNPTQIASFATPDRVVGLALSDGVAYLAHWFSGLLVVDVREPQAPTLIDSLAFRTPLEGVLDVEVADGHAYVGTTNGQTLHRLRIFDATDPGNLRELSSLKFGAGVADVEVEDRIVFVAAGSDGVRLIDASKPDLPFELGGVATIGARQVTLADRYVFVAGQQYGNPILEFGDEYLSRLDVAIDIAPHDELNLVHPAFPGLLPVAVLGSQDFDAADLDPRRVGFGPGRARPRPGTPLVDVNGDRVRDRLLGFPSEATGIAFWDTQSCLSGRTLQGRRLFGCDRVEVRGCGTGYEGAALVFPFLIYHRSRRRGDGVHDFRIPGRWRGRRDGARAAETSRRIPRI